ncbi:high nitrogen upregulated cytochrome P450 monooxygenase 2 [Mycena sanguinolenta]|nr:high nitrogen upregulated cytochrome P450 monooxygenase 2 [Mycena sanguinolenta]
MDSPALVWCAALGLVNHYFFHKYEPSSANIPLLLLPVQPVALLVLLGKSFSRLFYTYVVFLGSLSLSIIVYRLSPFHPLAQYPGPAIAKVTKLWSFWKTAQGYKYLWHKELHDKYGPYVRTGPNEISVIDAPAVCQILNFGGLEKGRYYESGRHKDTPPAIVCLSGEAHTAKRRVWNRAMTSACIREYEPLIVKRASQLVSCLHDRTSSSTVDLVHWLDLFAYDLMGDLAFGGGFEMLRDGRDVDGVGERIRGYTKASYLTGQLPWIVGTMHLFPQVAREIQQFNDFGQNLAIQRMKNGAVGTMDLWYHLADEGGVEKQKPTLKTSAADGIVAIVAASDTTTSTLSSTVWFLLSNPDYHRRVQQELDTVFVDGDDFFDVSKHQELQFLSACINEALRLHPPLPSNGPRQIHLNQPGRTIAGRFIPEGTSVYTPAYSLHRNPEYFFPHPDKFLPERWLPDAKFSKHDTSAFIPFSLGPANCVGQKFAKREMLMVLSALFKTFDMRFADGFDSEAWPTGMQDFFVVSRGPLLVNLTPREGFSRL